MAQELSSRIGKCRYGVGQVNPTKRRENGFDADDIYNKMEE